MPYAPNQRCSQGHVRRVGSLASEAVSAVVSSIYTHRQRTSTPIHAARPACFLVPCTTTLWPGCAQLVGTGSSTAVVGVPVLLFDSCAGEA